MDEIKLNNNYYIKIAKKEEKIPSSVIDINNLKLKKVLKSRNVILKIDFSKFSNKEYKSILKNLLTIKKITKNFGMLDDSQKIIVAYAINYDLNNTKHNDFISGINAIFYNTRYERYNYIYDTVCNYLDGYFYGKNLCDFKNNKCGEKRGTSSTTGCCHHFKHKALGPFSKLVQCEYLNKENHTCDAKCLSCKLFTCDYLESKGIKFRIKDILLLNVFFNPLQKYFIKYMVFTPKEKILKRLMWL